jgi:molybdate transport system substrate-binding protein
MVSAAASLTDAFTEMVEVFEASNPTIDLMLNLGASSLLREAILEGAPVDVYAPADIADMDQVAVGVGLGGDISLFARNRLQIAVPEGNPGRVLSLADFADDHLLLGLCAEGVPCGTQARRVLDAAGVAPAIDTQEPDANALLTRIAAGELDAGIVYVTDVVGAGAVESIEIPRALNLDNDYPIAVLGQAPHPVAAVRFVEFVLSTQGQAILRSHGFSTP